MISPYAHPWDDGDDRPRGRWEDASLDEVERVRIRAGGGCLADLTAHDGAVAA